jgi:hypothetical protein
LQEGELDMFVGYAGKDEFHLDAQAESFIYYCQMRGISIAVTYDPKGTHSVETATKMAPQLVAWLNERLHAHGIDGPK